MKKYNDKEFDEKVEKAVDKVNYVLFSVFSEKSLIISIKGIF